MQLPIPTAPGPSLPSSPLPPANWRVIDIGSLNMARDGSSNDENIMRTMLSRLPSTGAVLNITDGQDFLFPGTTGLEIADRSNILIQGRGSIKMPNIGSLQSVLTIRGTDIP